MFVETSSTEVSTLPNDFPPFPTVKKNHNQKQLWDRNHFLITRNSNSVTPSCVKEGGN